jgi:anti-anti-sigma regulatory factor
MIRAHTSPTLRRPLFLFAVDPVLDHTAAARAIDAFRNVRGTEPVVWLDLSAVGTASPAGLETLGSFAEAAREGRVTVRLIGVTPAIRLALEGTPLARYVWQPPTAA